MSDLLISRNSVNPFQSAPLRRVAVQKVAEESALLDQWSEKSEAEAEWLYDESEMGTTNDPPDEKGKKKPYKVPTDKDWHPEADESKRTPTRALGQRLALQRAERQQNSFAFLNSEGKSFQVRVFRSSGQNVQFQLGDEKRVNVWFDKSYTPDQQLEALARMVDYRSQTPDRYRKIQTLEVYPSDGSNNAASYNRGNRTMQFNGIEHVTKQNVNHEQGHQVGDFAGGDKFYQTTWKDAMNRDGKYPSTYAKTTVENDGHVLDDFAEVWTAYMEAYQSGPEALDALRKEFPSRVAVLEQIRLKGEQSPGWFDRIAEWWNSGEQTEVNVVEDIPLLNQRLTSEGLSFSIDAKGLDYNSKSIRDEVLSQLGFTQSQIDSYWQAYPELPGQNRPAGNGMRITDSNDPQNDWATREQVQKWDRDGDGNVYIDVEFETLKELKQFLLDQRAKEAAAQQSQPTATP